jgi:hypothetical protein
LRDPTAAVFNQPSPELSCEIRDVSTVTSQVFALFNSQSSRSRALALAVSASQESTSREETFERIYQRCLGRAPSAVERTSCLEHWDKMTQRHAGLKLVKPPVRQEIVRELVEENTGEKYQLTEKLFLAKDFVADLHPAEVPADIRGLMEVCLVILNTNEFLYLD